MNAQLGADSQLPVGPSCAFILESAKIEQEVDIIRRLSWPVIGILPLEETYGKTLLAATDLGKYVGASRDRDSHHLN